MRVLMRRSRQPVTCMACARQADGIGIFEPNADVRAWVCNDPSCIRATKEMVTMKPKDLAAIERRALFAAAGAMTLPMIQDVFSAMFDSGVRDLSAVTQEQIDAALERLHLSGAVSQHLEAALAAFGAHVAQAVAENAAPF
jgi:hypothetical protein